MHWGPDGWLWFNERAGDIYRLNPDTKEIQRVFHIPDVFVGPDNSGFHGMALHPNFPFEPYVYTHYTIGDFESQLVRWTYDVSHNTLQDSVVMMDRIGGSTSHNGSRIIFDGDEYLYLSMGDAFVGMTAQDVYNVNGSILRMNMDGSIPDDNPFPDSYVWSLGHRNPQGLVFGKYGILYSSEHGEANDDEVNLIEKGRNYGWPLVEGFCDQPSEQNACDSLNVREPLYEWTPTYAPCGLAYFDHPSIPEWRHSLLQAFLKEKRLTMLPLTDDGTAVIDTAVSHYFIQEFGRLRDVMVTPNGRVFICTSNNEFNGNWVPKDNYDKVIELVNPDYDYPEYIAPRSAAIPTGSIFPNPTRNHLWIATEEASPTLEVWVADAMGNEVYYQSLTTIFDDQWHLSLPAAMGTGVYSIRYYDGETLVTSKFVVSR